MHHPKGASRSFFPGSQPLENQAQLLSEIGLVSDISPWFARGHFLYAHIALTLAFMTATMRLARRTLTGCKDAKPGSSGQPHFKPHLGPSTANVMQEVRVDDLGRVKSM